MASMMKKVNISPFRSVKNKNLSDGTLLDNLSKLMISKSMKSSESTTPILSS